MNQAVHTPRPAAALVAAALLAVAVLAAPRAGGQITGPEADGGRIEFERWYQVLVENQPAGWAHAWVTRSRGVLSTVMRMELTLARGPTTMIVGIDSRFDETDDGEPIEARSHQSLGAMTVTQTMRFSREGVELVSRQGDMEHRQVFAPAAQKWLPPAAASRHVEQQLAGGARRISFHTLDPSAGPTPIEMKIAVGGPTQVETAEGRRTPAIAWEVETSQLPGMTMTEYVDEKGRALRSDVPAMPGLTITLVAAERETVLGEAAEGAATATETPARIPAQIPAQVMDNTFVEPDRPLPRPRELRQAVYELRFDPADSDGDLAAPEIARGGYQRVAWADSRTAVVVVDLDEPVNPGDDLPGTAHRRASLTLNYRDPAVMKLLGQALAGDAKRLPAARRAEHLRRFVHDFIEKKDLSRGFATAGETAATAQGDCTEHAVLLAAMLRGSGIPSRTVTGLIYVERFMDRENVFGYHMWTQAWLSEGPSFGGSTQAGTGSGDGGGRWVDLDATLADKPFDAGHIALAVSAQDEAAALNDMAKIVPWLGRLSIRVLQPAP